MDTFTAYRLWHVCNLHLSSESYCVKKYQGRVRNIETIFERLSVSEKAKFSALAKRVQDKKDYATMMIACLMSDVNPRYAPVSECLEILKTWQTKKESLSYVIDNNHETVLESNPSFMKLIMMYSNKVVTPEYILVYDFIDNQLDRVYNDHTFIGFKQELLKLRKFRTFFNAEKYHEKIFATERH